MSSHMERLKAMSFFQQGEIYHVVGGILTHCVLFNLETERFEKFLNPNDCFVVLDLLEGRPGETRVILVVEGRIYFALYNYLIRVKCKRITP